MVASFGYFSYSEAATAFTCNVEGGSLVSQGGQDVAKIL